jgi:hypothetical protein
VVTKPYARERLLYVIEEVGARDVLLPAKAERSGLPQVRPALVRRTARDSSDQAR